MKASTHCHWLIALSLVSGLLVAQEDAAPIPKIKRTSLGLYINAAQAYEMWKAHPDQVKILDVRTPEEYFFVGHAPMAKNIPLFFLDYSWNAAKKKPRLRLNPHHVEQVRRFAGVDDTLLIMCRAGTRSSKSVNRLAKAGYTKAYTIIDGFEGDKVKNPKSPDFGRRTLNGWRISKLPWTYKLDPKLMYLSETSQSRPTSRAGSIQRWGSLREALRDGHAKGRIDVGTVAAKGVYGIGALEDLRGEITVFDGEVWISCGSKDRPVTIRSRKLSAPATILFSSKISRWKTIRVEKDVSASEFDAFVAAQAKAAGLDLETGFHFVVEGQLTDLDVHVLAGECPIRANMLGVKMTSPPFATHFDRVQGRLVGVFSTDSVGVMTHHDSNSHNHVIIDNDAPFTGHAESVGIAAGGVLKLPLK